MTPSDPLADAERLERKTPDEMSVSERADVAMTMVDGWHGDPRGALNCFYSQALTAEVRRLRAALGQARPDECSTHLTMGVCNRGTPGCAKEHSRFKEGVKLLQTLLGPCEGKPDGHGWQKCRRCTAMHGLENRFPLSMKALNAVLAALPVSAPPPVSD